MTGGDPSHIPVALVQVLVISVHVNTISPANIVAFRDFLRARFPEAHAEHGHEAEIVDTGLSCLDALGVGRGTITEIVGPPRGSGTGVLLAALLQRDATVTELTALVDGSDAFDPWSVPAEALERLLWVRCREPAQAVRATDLLLRDGNIPLVLLDLQLHSLRAVQGLPSSVWHRLRLLAEKSGTSLCAFTPVRTVTCARTRLVVNHRFRLDDQYVALPVLAAQLRPQVDRQSQAVFTASSRRAIA